MSSQKQEQASWDFDSDEIASLASEDLHENRPNRWRGDPSAWRALTRSERELWLSLKQTRDADLALHLFNVAALKRPRDEETRRALRIQTAAGEEVTWRPPDAWTAWPLKSRDVPVEGLMHGTKTADHDEAFTFRRDEAVMPSTELEEELSATILRQAKNRFRRRQQRSQPQPTEPSTPIIASQTMRSSPPPPPPPPPAVSSSPARPSSQEPIASTEVPPASQEPDGVVAAPKPIPVMSADDERSYMLLRPSVRHILTQLDAGLEILRRTDVGAGYGTDSATDTSDSSSSSHKRGRGRPRSTWSSATTSPSRPLTRRGRPRKVHVPREGESYEEMVERVAREAHRRLPVRPEDKDAAFEAWLRAGEGEGEGEGDDPATAENTARNATTVRQRKTARKRRRPKRLRETRPRDWTDVMGVAALAGFPPAVIARATKRCADLFGEPMLMHTMNEAPASRGTGVVTTTYRPEPIRLGSSDMDEEDEEEEDNDRHTPAASIRRRSRSISRARTPSSRGRSSSVGSHSETRSQSSGGCHFCPVATCSRAAKGFTRRPNLARHVKLMHPGHNVEEDVDSDDAVEGAVHVDGFLRRIRPGAYWGREDMEIKRRRLEEQGRARASQRRRRRRRSEDEENLYQDDDDEDRDYVSDSS
ncbi:hypothetical protein B0I35DRAFT_460329 [Stachybotrys elegans]|uniref:C2H2-type domain-containing protein n=1 Tax=Stachybotrys elegans TaxID=80388 RepID=A0A8K0SNR9_9HYPO|nr:hypothetical protein B0I35DRAFT_460329 [Stachybotrys elegans]